MKKILYYTVEKELTTVGDTEEATGNKLITVYEIIDNQPKIFAEIDAANWDSSEAEIQVYLDNNGYGDECFDFCRL